jgi:hypothetical protein
MSGEDGTVTVNAVEIHIIAWGITINGEVIDVTDSSASAYKVFIPSGWKSWNGTFEGFVESGVAGAAIGATAAEAIFLAKTGVTWTGDVILTVQNVNLDVVGPEAIKTDYTFQGTDSLVAATA